LAVLKVEIRGKFIENLPYLSLRNTIVNMNITQTELSIRHLAWSNQKFFALFQDLPNEVFSWCSAQGEWPIGRLLTHLVGSSQWFRYCLEGTLWTELERIENSEIAVKYLPIMADLDEILLKHSKLPDAELEIKEEENIIHATRSLILSQAVMHASEHKGQIASILKMNGLHIDLDALDVWSFKSSLKGS
jgi:uncharacterized damage-inducible protein DinB